MERAIMSNWDLGFGQESADSREPRYPPPPGGPGGAAFRSGDTGWPGDTGWAGAGDYPRDGGDPYDPPQDAPYPLTYERDDFDGRPSSSSTFRLASPPAQQQPPRSHSAPGPSPWPAAPPPADRFEGDHYAGGQPATAPHLNEPWWNPDSRPRWRRWPVPAAIVAVLAAVLGATLVLLTSTHPNAPAASGRATPTMMATSAASRPTAGRTPAPRNTAAAPPLTLAAAEAALADYTTVNNSANALRSDSELAMVETGASYAIDAGVYTVGRADGAAPYPAYGPVTATYYIPRAEPASGPRWFVVRVANAFSAHPKKVTSTEYLLFTQTASGGTWRNAVEPYLLPGADAPQIAIGADGLATAVSGTSASLAAAPGQLAGLTAASLDGARSAVSVPGQLADRSEQKFWRAKLPTATVTDAHAAATGPEGQTFALLTANGGALVFYTDSAELTITPPAGSKLHLTVPGFYSPAQALSSAGLTYLDQFAAYDPPARVGVPTVLGEYSGPTGSN